MGTSVLLKWSALAQGRQGPPTPASLQLVAPPWTRRLHSIVCVLLGPSLHQWQRSRLGQVLKQLLQIQGRAGSIGQCPSVLCRAVMALGRHMACWLGLMDLLAPSLLAAPLVDSRPVQAGLDQMLSTSTVELQCSQPGCSMVHTGTCNRGRGGTGRPVRCGTASIQCHARTSQQVRLRFCTPLSCRRCDHDSP